jgi:hypothetical protein
MMKAQVATLLPSSHQWTVNVCPDFRSDIYTKIERRSVPGPLSQESSTTPEQPSHLPKQDTRANRHRSPLHRRKTLDG